MPILAPALLDSPDSTSWEQASQVARVSTKRAMKQRAVFI